jgi:mgtE-like transporter
VREARWERVIFGVVFILPVSVLRDAARIYKQSIAILGVSLIGGLFAGSVLGADIMAEAFTRYPGLLLLLPAFLATRGNVYGALGARISTGLHQGLIKPEFKRNERLVNAVVASFVNGITISVFIGFMSWGILFVLGRDSAALGELVGITLVAGLLTSVVMILGLLLLIFGGYRRGIDPDNLVGPIVTTLGDMFGVVFLYIGVVVVEVFS